MKKSVLLAELLVAFPITAATAASLPTKGERVLVSFAAPMSAGGRPMQIGH